VPEPANTPHTEEAEVRHLPVLAEIPEARPLERLHPRMLPAPAVAAVGGFLAGVAAFVLVRVLRRAPDRARRVRLGRGRRREAREIAASRSFLVDIHLLKR
jgi:hypothetical protein